ncbi:MAG: PKD domain-containing protein [Myxococcales bacterium]|nr:PKD domain-containing protein [Myxococcales bacterium]
MNVRNAVVTALFVGTFLQAASASAAVDVVPVPWNALDPTIPHQAYNGHVTTFKAIARGGTGTYTVEWDYDGDGIYDTSYSRANRYDLSTTYTYPVQPVTITFQATVRVTSGADVATGIYPVRVFADVPADPTFASDRQLQIMRGVAVDDALWWMHLNMTGRGGNEDDPFTGSQITGYYNHGSYPTASAATFMWAMGLNGHFVAHPVGKYIGTYAPGAEAENDARWMNDPYAEDVLRNINYLLTTKLSVITGIPAADESNEYGAFPMYFRTPIPGTDDGVGFWLGYSPGDQTVYPFGHVLSGFSVARLTGLHAQVGDTTYVRGRKYEFLVQQMVDAMVWAQIDGGCGDGGWYYTPNPPTSCDYMDGSTNLWGLTGVWHADKFMSDSGVIVPNRARFRAVNNFVTNAYAPSGTEYCGRYRSNSSGCDFTLTAGHLIVAGWTGINNFNVADPNIAFPSYSGHTKGTLRTYYDRYVNLVSGRWLTFQGSTVNTGWASGLWEIGAGGLADFERTDRRGNTYAMLHMQDAARAHEPVLTTWGPNNWLRQFSIYLIQNQYADGHYQGAWCGGPVCANSESSGGMPLSTSWSALILSPDAIPPLAIAEASAGLTIEGTSVTFDGRESDPGTANPTYIWDFGNGDTAEGELVVYAYPDNGVYTVTLTLESIGGLSTDSFLITVGNAAPVVNAGADVALDEGASASFASTVTDPGSADTHTYAWDFGDGLGTSTDEAPTYTWGDNGPMSVVLTATDDDGGATSDTLIANVRNVAPTITSMPPTGAIEGQVYSYSATFSDPGTLDTHACSLSVAPIGMVVDPMTCVVTWTPDYAQALGAHAPVTLCVTDDDLGRTCQPWEISVRFIDTDGDGLPDSWEEFYFGDLLQDTFDDPDDDGLVNAEEFAELTDPTMYDGPSAPVPVAPVCGSQVSVLAPTYLVDNATDPQSSDLAYEFELYADILLTSLVTEEVGVTGGAVQTSWNPGTVLLENDRYFWRVRATDGQTYGAWSVVCDFLINTVNEVPTAPGINFPDVGTQVSSTSPLLVVDDALDPEGDLLTYTFELFSDHLLTTLIDSQDGVPDAVGGTTSWNVTAVLLEDTWYYWRVRAADSFGAAGTWSETGRFFVSALNGPPEAPTILAPENGTVMNKDSATMVILNADDPDLNPLVYDFELATDQAFANVIDTAVDLPEQGNQTTVWDHGATLEENGRYCWRVRSDDGLATSEYVSACFVASAVNDPPSTPTLMNPSDGSKAQHQRPTLSWIESNDPEGDDVLYDIEIATTIDFAQVVAFARGVAGNSTALAYDLLEDGVYFWRARAIDSAGAASEYSEPNAFTVELPVTGLPGLTGSTCGCVVAKRDGAGAAGGGLLLIGLGGLGALLVTRRRRTV